MKMIMAQPKPGQSREDFIREMKEKHGADGNGTVMDGTNMNPEQLKAMLAAAGMGAADIDAVLAGKESGTKKGIFSRITDALLK